MKVMIPMLLCLLFLLGCSKTPEEQLAGSYKDGPYTFVLLENGTVAFYRDGKKADEGPWKVDGKEVHFGSGHSVDVFRIEDNGDLTRIADIVKGQRKDLENVTPHDVKRMRH